MEFKFPENQVVDTITIPELSTENMYDTFDSIMKKHSYDVLTADYIPSDKTFYTWFKEYLLDNDVKVWQGPVYAIFYKERQEFYDDYLECAKIQKWDDIMDKETFFQNYLMTRHKQILESQKED